MAKFTKATAKSFINKNRSTLKILVKTSFDGMTDCCESTGQKEFVPVVARDTNACIEHTMGIQGVWFVNGGGDYFTPITEGGEIVGFEVYNCCGTFTLRK